MYGYVYETTCLINGMKYIGMHKWDKPEIDPNYFGSGIYLRRALEKYGKENFTCTILECCDTREELSEREKYFISINKAPINENFYNIEDGGLGGHSEYYVQPITQNQLNALEKGRHLPASEKQRKQLSDRRKNIIVSQETRQKLSIAGKDRRTINNGNEQKHIHKNEIDKYLTEGWVLGELPKDRSERIKKFKQTHYSRNNSEWKNNLSKSFKGRRWMNNGLEQHQVKPEDIEKYLLNGYTFGKFKLTKKFND